MPIAALIFLTLVNLLNYFDRYIVQSVEPRITFEFGLSNVQAGYVVSAFVIGYLIFSPLFGLLGDRFDKRRVMTLALLGWSLATALTGWATGLYTFIAARILVGIGEAGYGAIVPVYLNDRIKDPLNLNRALAIFYVAVPVGSALGYVAGGQISAVYGWRLLFLGAALPGVFLALGFLALKRVTSSNSIADSGSNLAVSGSLSFSKGLQAIFNNRCLVMVILGYVLNTFALNGVAAFIVRHGVSLGLSEAQAATYFGVILVASGLLGTLGGGYLASYFAKGGDIQGVDIQGGGGGTIASLLKFVAFTTLLAVPFLGASFIFNSVSLFLAGCFLAEVLIFAGVAPLNSVIVSRAPLGYEAFTQGFTIFAIQLGGGFLGPVLIGLLADLTGGLRLALQGTTVALLASAIVWGMGWRMLGGGEA